MTAIYDRDYYKEKIKEIERKPSFKNRFWLFVLIFLALAFVLFLLKNGF